MEKYLNCTEIIDCETLSIKEKTEALTEGLETAREKAIALFYFVRDKIKYNPFASGTILEPYRASATLERGNGFCIHKAILLVALARAVGIPARLRFADIRNHLLSGRFAEMIGEAKLLTYHGYAELYIDGKWVLATPAFDLQMCRKERLIPVDFDGEHDAKLHRFNQDGKLHIEYVKEHGHYEDLPWEEVINARKEYLARLGLNFDEFMARWNKCVH